eukprot:Sspe_Gene.45623::Locus_22623_Transcript_3_3_Confidence_0.667_Length_1835::g.45623::m.45623
MARGGRAQQRWQLEEGLGQSAAQSGFLTDTNTYDDIGSSVSQVGPGGVPRQPSRVRFDPERPQVATAMSESSVTMSDLYSSYDGASASAEQLMHMDPDQAMNDNTVLTNITVSIDYLKVNDSGHHPGFYCVEGKIVTTSKLHALRRKKGLVPDKLDPIATFRTGMSRFHNSICEWKTESGRTMKFRINGVRMPRDKCHDSQLNRRYLVFEVLKADTPDALPEECVPFMKDKGRADLVFKTRGGEKSKKRKAEMQLRRHGVHYTYTLQVRLSMHLQEEAGGGFAAPPYAPIPPPMATHMDRHYDEYDDDLMEHPDPRLKQTPQAGQTLSWAQAGKNLIVGTVGGAVLGCLIGGLVGFFVAPAGAKGGAALAAKAGATKSGGATAATAAHSGGSAGAAKGATGAAGSHAGYMAPSSAHVGSATPSTDTQWQAGLVTGAWVGGTVGFLGSAFCTAVGKPDACNAYEAPPQDDEEFVDPYPKKPQPRTRGSRDMQPQDYPMRGSRGVSRSEPEFGVVQPPRASGGRSRRY